MADNPFDEVLNGPPADASVVTPGFRPETPAPTNAFDAILNTGAVTQNQNRRAVLTEATAVNPDKHAEVLNLSKQTGISPAVVERNTEQVKQQATANSFDALLTGSPVTSEFLSVGDNAKVAHDDVEKLTAIERVSRGFERGRLSQEHNKAGSAIMMSRFPDAPETRERLAPIKGRLAEIGDSNGPGFVGWLSEAAELIGQQVQATFSTADATISVGGGMVIGATVGSAVPVIGSIAGGLGGAYAGIRAFQAKNSFEVEAGGAYLEYRELGIDHQTAQFASLGVGVINAGLEFAGTTLVLAPWSSAAKAVFKKGAREAMKDVTVLELAKKAAIAYGGSIAGEVSTEVLQELFTIAGGEIAKSFTDKSIAGITQEQATERLKEVAVKTFKAMVILGAPGAGAQFAAQVSAAKQANKDAEALDELQKAIMSSALTERSPELAAQFAGVNMSQHGMEEVFIPVERLAEFAEASGVEPGQLYKDLGVENQVADAEVVGGDVRISAQQYVHHIAMSDQYEVIAPHIRASLDGMTPAEAEEFEKSGIEEEIAELEAKQVSRDTTTTPEQAASDLADAIASGDQARVDEAVEKVNRPAPVDAVVDIAKGYMESFGVPYSRVTELAKVDPERGKRIAQAYEEMEHNPNDPEVKLAYDMFIKETLAQFQEVKKLNLKIEFIKPGENPYAEGSKAVIEDIRKGHLWVFPTEQGFGSETDKFPGNPMLQETEEFIGDKRLTANDVFRITHDVFGHSKEGFSFGPRGEESAWQTHSAMYSPLAARAMTTETRGQNSWVNFGPFGEQNQADRVNTKYADQKTGLLPEWVSTEGLSTAATDFSPEVEAEVTLAEEQLGLRGLFNTAAEAGLTPTQYREYLLAVQRAAEAPRVNQEREHLKQKQRENTKEWETILAEVEAEVRTQVEGQSVYRVMDNIQADTQMDRAALLEVIGVDEAFLETLPKLSKGKSLYTPKGKKGIHPKAIANQYGWDHALEMLYALAEAKPKEEVIKAQALATARARHGGILREGEAIQRALEFSHNDLRAHVLAFELSLLRGAQKQGRIKVALLKKAAKARIRNHSVKSVNTNKYMVEAARQGRLAAKLLRKGDRAGAAEAKFRQLLSFQYAQEAFNLRREIAAEYKSVAKYMKKRETFPSVDAGFVDQIKEVLKDRPNPKDMIVKDWQALYEKVKGLEAQGKRLKIYSKAERDNYFFDAINKMVEAAERLPDLARLERQRVGGAGAIVQGYDKTIEKVTGLDAIVRKVEFLLEKLDGGKIGPWHQAIFQRIADAQTAQLDREKGVIGDLITSLDALYANTKEKAYHEVYLPGLGIVRTRATLLMIALNSGNESNYSKMLEGEKWADKSEGVTEALSLLTEREARWVQSVWDSFEAMRPEVEAIYRDEKGVSPERILPREIKVGGVTLKGGYMPMLYDHMRSIHPGVENAEDAMSDPRIQGAVYSGLVKSRTESYSAPILLDINHLPRAVEQAIHFITHYQAVRDIKHFLRNKEVTEVVQRKLGIPYLKELQNWVGAVASNGLDGTNLGSLDSFFSYLRSSMTAAVMAFSWTTGVSQTFGLSTSVGVLGKMPDGSFSSVEGLKWMKEGFKKYLTDMDGTVTQAFELSGELRHRLGAADRDIKHALKRLASGQSADWTEALTDGKVAGAKIVGTLKGAQRAGLMAISHIQLRTVDIPTWVGAFNQGLSRNMDTNAAVKYADNILRTSQATGHIKDLSAIQRQKGIVRAATMFSTYLMLLYNLQAEAFGNVKKVKDLPGAVAKLMWIAAIPALLDGLMRDEFPDEEKRKDPNWETWVAIKIALYGFGAVPVLGKVADSAYKGFDPATLSIDSIWKSAKKSLKLIGDLATGEKTKMDAGDWKVLLIGVGMLIGLPGTYQGARVLDAIDAGDKSTPYDFLIGHKD